MKSAYLGPIPGSNPRVRYVKHLLSRRQEKGLLDILSRDGNVVGNMDCNEIDSEDDGIQYQIRNLILLQGIY